MSGKPKGPAIRRDCQCPRAKHEHGTVAAYRADWCRCAECRAAAAETQRTRYRLRAYGTWKPNQPICGTRRRVEALVWLGWSIPKISERCGICEPMLRRQLHADLRWMSPRNADKIRHVYDEMSMMLPPERTHGERQTASKMRNLARRRGYLPPLAWDDETIDDPEAQPSVLDAASDLDEFEVELLMAGERRVAKWARSAERVEAVRRLAARGMTDSDIGARLLMSGAAVLKVRERNGIAAGVPSLRVHGVRSVA